MLPLERRHALIKFVSKKGSCSIPEMSEILNVSEMTVRRDLKQLEEEGFVQRTHGGAISVSSPRLVEPAFEEKRESRQPIKEKLADYAVKHFVQDNGVIIMEGGTTVSVMANYLLEFYNLTVATNGLNTLAVLRSIVSTCTVLGCGGILREMSNTFVGPIAEQFFSQIHAQYAFFSASGFTPETGFTDPNPMERQVKLAMAQSARKKIMLIDSAKFSHVSLLTTFAMRDIDILITDSEAPEVSLKPLRDAGVEVHVVK
ncbi:MAG: DeoR/GlpR transcriptional regulator [Gorillibacterium sp.]|nr:DeoR/GlpR transcriptional regulator [Gorillibacterium sp.]